MPSTLLESPNPVYNELVDVIARGGGPQSIVGFRLSESAQERAYTLLDHKKSGDLTADEERELQQFVELEHIVRIAKIRARQLLIQSKAA